MKEKESEKGRKATRVQKLNFAKRTRPSSTLSPVSRNAPKVLVQSLRGSSVLSRPPSTLVPVNSWAGVTPLATPINSPSRQQIALQNPQSPSCPIRTVCRPTPPYIPPPTLGSQFAISPLGLSVASFENNFTDHEEPQVDLSQFNYSQLSAVVESGSMSFLRSEARKVKVNLSQGAFKGKAVAVPAVGIASEARYTQHGTTNDCESNDWLFSFNTSPQFQELVDTDEVVIEANEIAGSPEHARVGRRLAPPSLRGKAKDRAAVKGKSLKFATGSAEPGRCTTQAAELLQFPARAPPELQASSRLRSGSQRTVKNVTKDVVYVGVEVDVFLEADLNPLEQLLKEVTCQLIREWEDEITGMPMVTVRTVHPPGEPVDTFRSTVNFDFDRGLEDENPDNPQTQISNSPERVVPFTDSNQSIPDELNPMNLQSVFAEDLLELCEEIEDEANSEDSDDWIEDGHENSDKSNPGSERDSDSDWENYREEIIEEELPKLGIYADSEEAWKRDPWVWRYSDEFWNSRSSEFSHDTTFKGGASVPRPRLYGPQTPIEIFSQIFDEGCLRLIVTETNRYAHENPTKAKWTDITRPELRAWIGVAIYMGICSLPARRFHWKTEEALFKHRMIPSIMTRDRFEQILHNLHLVDNNKLNLDRSHPDFDKICKVRPFLDRISYKSRCLKDVDEQLTVDEMMILGGGRLCPIMQHNPNKPVKHGIKILATCSASTKYVYDLLVYCGAENSEKKSILDQTMAMLKVVPRHLNHRVTMDNWFTSVQLFDTLLQEGILCLGTVRTNRLGWPTSMSVKFDKAQRGDLTWRMHRSGTMAAAMWMDHTQVALLSTCVRPEDAKCTVERWDKKKKKRVSVLTSPTLVAYQIWMRGVDVHDQLREVYSLRQKTRKWWHRLFWFALDTAMTNSWILYRLHQKHSGLPYGTHLDFLLSLAASLTGGSVTARKSAEALAVYIPPYAQRGGGVHYSDRAKTRRSCAECGKRTTMACPRCRWLGLCLGYCFVQHHSRKQNCCMIRS